MTVLSDKIRRTQNEKRMRRAKEVFSQIWAKVIRPRKNYFLAAKIKIRPFEMLRLS